MATAQKEPSQIQKDLLATKLVGSKEYQPRPGWPDRLGDLPEAEELYGPAKLRPGRPDGPKDQPDRQKDLPEAEEPCEVARCQLCDVARVNPDFKLSDSARATALSPLVDSKGQRVSRSFGDDYTVLERDAVGLRTPVATVQVICALLYAEDSKAGHLLGLIQA